MAEEPSRLARKLAGIDPAFAEIVRSLPPRDESGLPPDWLHLSVEAEDNADLDVVSFRLVDTDTTKLALPAGGDSYRATYEIDFWHDYVAGYTVEAYAWDLAGNVVSTTTGGGLEYVAESLVASFLAFFGNPETAGGVLGFFVGFAKGLFEDLTIFLHLQEMWEAPQHQGIYHSGPYVRAGTV